MIAIKKLKTLRYMANFFPNVLISKGNVTIPIIVRVVINAATELTVAPSDRNEPASGKASNDGMCIKLPATAIRMKPIAPFS